jgi:hypothetical protein
MTLPAERTRAVIATREFLVKLIYPQRTPRIPRAIREQAMELLRHYPTIYEMEDPARHFSNDR